MLSLFDYISNAFFERRRAITRKEPPVSAKDAKTQAEGIAETGCREITGEKESKSSRTEREDEDEKQKIVRRVKASLEKMGGEGSNGRRGGTGVDVGGRDIGLSRGWIIPGQLVWMPNKHEKCVKFGKYFVSPNMLHAMERDEQSIFRIHGVLRNPLTRDNYALKFHTLLKAEEATRLQTIKQFRLKDIILLKSDEYLTLTVPSLANEHLSPGVGDKVFLNQPLSDPFLFYEGFIHKVNRFENKVFLRFIENFHHDYAGEKYNAFFELDRMRLRVNHHAVDLLLNAVDSVLFPTDICLKKDIFYWRESIRWINRALNDKQKLAVINILGANCRPTPYLLVGPPGTGKTATIIEAILQVIHAANYSRVLVCSTSDHCADQIAIKLLESNAIYDMEVVRLIDANYSGKVPLKLKSVISEAHVSPADKWLSRRIIVTSCNTSGSIYELGPSISHFTHCFIDDANSGTEPEVLVPIGLTAIGFGVIVLAGDGRQLPPICKSFVSRACGLQTPLISRLLSLQPYLEDCLNYAKHGFYDPRFIVKLNVSYRFEPRMAHVNSQMFYDSTIESSLKPDNEVLDKLGLKFNLLFHGVEGQQTLEANICEEGNENRVQCVAYLGKIFEVGINHKDVGVLTNCKRQLAKLRHEMQMLSLDPCISATIEEFQGMERKVIILSMVDCCCQFVSMFDEKRFNVATTRAKSLVIVVGDLGLLSKSYSWRAFIDYCRDNGGCFGSPIGQYQPRTESKFCSKTV